MRRGTRAFGVQPWEPMSIQHDAATCVKVLFSVAFLTRSYREPPHAVATGLLAVCTHPHLEVPMFTASCIGKPAI